MAQTNTSNKKEPNRRGSEPLRPRRAFYPLPSLRQGERARPPAGPPSCKQAQGPLETREAAKREKLTTHQKTNKRLYRLASKKRPQSSPERIQNRTGPRMETPEQKGRTAKTGEQDKAAGTERKKNNSKCGGGVWRPVSLNCISQKKKRQKRETRQTTSPTQTLRQRERDNKKTRPDMKRIFRKHFRGEIARKYAKTIGKSLSKT